MAEQHAVRRRATLQGAGWGRGRHVCERACMGGGGGGAKQPPSRGARPRRLHAAGLLVHQGARRGASAHHGLLHWHSAPAWLVGLLKGPSPIAWPPPPPALPCALQVLRMLVFQEQWVGPARPEQRQANPPALSSLKVLARPCTELPRPTPLQLQVSVACCCLLPGLPATCRLLAMCTWGGAPRRAVGLVCSLSSGRAGHALPSGIGRIGTAAGGWRGVWSALWTSEGQGGLAWLRAPSLPPTASRNLLHHADVIKSLRGCHVLAIGCISQTLPLELALPAFWVPACRPSCRARGTSSRCARRALTTSTPSRVRHGGSGAGMRLSMCQMVVDGGHIITTGRSTGCG